MLQQRFAIKMICGQSIVQSQSCQQFVLNDILTCPQTSSNIILVMDIDTLIAELTLAKQQGVTTVEVVDQNFYQYDIDTMVVSKDEEQKTFMIKVGSEW